MPWFGFLILTGLGCVLFPCQGVVYPPSNGSEFTFLPGSTEKIKWTFDDNITALTARNWIFASTGSSTVRGLASIFGTGSAIIDSSNPVDIAIEKPATLILKNVDRRYNGKYTFRVSGSFISDSTVDVFIAEKPSVTLNCPSSVHLNEGDNFTCLCRGQNGNPPANVTWFKDGAKFTGVGTEKQTLNLLNVSKAENETYNCVATSYPHENYTDEKSIELIFILTPTVKLNCSTFIDVRRGDNVTCPCECEGGNPPANCTWYKNATRIGEIRKEKNKLNYRVESNDSGNYTCVGRSHVNAEDKRKSIEVAVYYTTIKFSKNPAIINWPVTIACSSHGLPQPKYVIYHNNTYITSNMTYTISRVNWNHTGTYKCVTNNVLKNDSDSKFLIVKEKPTTSSSTTMSSSAMIKPSTATPAIPSPSSSTTKNKKGGDPDESSEESNTAALVGGICGGAAGLLLLLLVVFCCKSQKDRDPDESSEESNTAALVGGICGCAAVLLLGVFCCKSKKRDNKSDINPNGSRVISNYEMEEEAIDGNAYDTVKPPDSCEGSQKKEKPPGDTLPPVYAAVDKNNRGGNALYASLDSEALNRPGSTKKQPETPKAPPTEYASIDFMKTAKTPNDDSVST